MTTITGQERAAIVVMPVVMIVGLLVPMIAGVLVGVTNDTTLRAGDLGTFVSSSTSAGGFGARSATTVQTSIGSIVVSGPLSAVRGQRLEVEDRLKSGLHLCVRTTPPICADVVGEWTGPMQSVQHQRHAFAWLAALMSVPGAVMWFLAGLIATVIAGMVFIPDDGPAPDEVPSEGRIPPA
jgi:hypothetical protein